MGRHHPSAYGHRQHDRRLTMAGTVFVACKLPNGITVQAHDMIEVDEPTPAGGRRVLKGVPVGKAYPCRGISVPFGFQANLQYGFAITPNVDAEAWAKWLEANKASEFIINGLVFAHPKEAEVLAMARERQHQRTGLEPLDPGKLSQEFRGSERLSPLEQAPESAKPQPQLV